MKRQLSGAVKTVPKELEMEMAALAREHLELQDDGELDQALARAGLSACRPEPLYIPAARLIPLCELWLHYNPEVSKRGLASQLSETLNRAGVPLGVDPLQIALAGKQQRARHEVLDALLALLEQHGIVDEADALGRRDELAKEIAVHRQQMRLVAPDRLLGLVSAWKLHHNEPSSRTLSRVLRDRLGERGIPMTIRRAEEIVGGRVKRVRQVAVDVMEELLRDALAADQSLDEAIAKAAGKRTELLDLCWVHAPAVAALAGEWLSLHPGQTQRKLAIAVAATCKRMGYATSHNTVQPILGGHKKRCRGFVYRALLKQFRGRSDTIPADAVVPSKWADLALASSERHPRQPSKSRNASRQRDDAAFRQSRPRPLPRDAETRLAIEIVETEGEILHILLSIPQALPALSELRTQLEDGRVAAWDIIVDGRSPRDRTHERRAREILVDVIDETLRLAQCPDRPEATTEMGALWERVRVGHQRLRALTDAVVDGRAPASDRLREAWGRLDAARSSLICANMGLVHSLAARYHGRALDHGDLVQEGSVGLMRAADKFDHRRGVKFATYAGWWIRQAIQRAISDRGRAIRLPVHILQEASKVKRATSRFVTRMGRGPTDAELMDLTGIADSKLIAIAALPPEPASLASPLHGDPDGATLSDAISDPTSQLPVDVVLSQELQAAVSVAVDALPDREAWAVRNYFGIACNNERTLADLGRERGLTRERIRQIKLSGLTTLRRRHGALLRELIEFELGQRSPTG